MESFRARMVSPLKSQWSRHLPILVGCWGSGEERVLCSGASETVSCSVTRKEEKQNSATTESSFTHIVLSKQNVFGCYLLVEIVQKPQSCVCCASRSGFRICPLLTAHLLTCLASKCSMWTLRGGALGGSRQRIFSICTHLSSHPPACPPIHISVFLFTN